MIENEVDYKRLYEQVSEELTQARIALFHIRSRNFLSVPDGYAIRQWIQQNYLLIIVVIMAVSIVLSFIDFIGRHK